MADLTMTEPQLEKQAQEDKIHKRELLTILMVCVIIAILLSTLYYLERNYQILTKLGDYITSHIL
jgi:Na+-transporting NADH:ubiquinone oxidoreductase subunit NqrC